MRALVGHKDFIITAGNMSSMVICSPCQPSHMQTLCTQNICGTAEKKQVAQLCLTLCDPTDSSTPGFPVHHKLPEFTQTHVH